MSFFSMRSALRSEGSTLERDFTYVDDIVNGVMGALRYRPRRCGEILNFGRGHPENVGELIRLLEKELDKKAIIVGRLYFRARSYFCI